MDRWARAILKRPVAVIAWAAALLLGGSWAAQRVPLEWVPTVELPEVRVSATWPGASPRAMERYVTAPIERAVQAVEGTARVESLSEEGRATVTAQVSQEQELGPYVARLGERLAIAERVLPHRVTPRLTKRVPEALRDEQGFMTIQLVGPQAPAALRRWAREELAPALGSLAGVADVRVAGGAERELLVRLDPGRLAELGLTPSAIRQALARASAGAVYGRLRDAGQAALLYSPAEEDAGRLRRLVVGLSRGRPALTEPYAPQLGRPELQAEASAGAALPGAAAARTAPQDPLDTGRPNTAGPNISDPDMASPGMAGLDAARAAVPIRLQDVAEVTLGPAPRRSISRIDGQPVVTLTLSRAPASHLLEAAEAVRARLEAARPALPEGARLLVADDKSASVRAELRGLAWRGGVGLALVALALLLMLRSVRVVGVVLFSVAVALAVALALMGPLGLTLNLLTLAGLALTFGLLVDNSVVVAEQLMLQRARWAARGRAGWDLDLAATRSALRAVGLPLVGGTCTTVAVMGPLVYLSGELRALFLPFGALVALTLAASLVTAAALVPALGRFLPPPRGERRQPLGLRRLVEAPFRGAARYPKLACTLLVLILGTPLWLLPTRVEVPEAPAGGEMWPEAARRLAGAYNATVGAEPVRAARAWLDPALGGIFRPFVQQTSFGEQWNFEPRPEARVRLGFPPGSPIGRADSLLRRFEAVALAAPSVRRTIAHVTERSATLRVQFFEEALTTPAPYVTREELIQEAVLLAGIDVSVSGLLPRGYFSGSGSGISGFAVEAYGPNYEDLAALTERFARRVKAASRRVASVNTNAGRFGNQEPREVLRIDWPAAAAARTGVSARELAHELRPVLTTRFPAFWADLAGETQLPVRIVVAGAAQADIAGLAGRPLPVSDTTQVKIGAVTEYRVDAVPSRIERAGQQYKRYVRVDYRGPYRMGNEFVDTQLEGFPTPPGYRLERAEGGFFTSDTRSALGWVLAGTAALVFLAVAVVFESWRLAGVVLLSLPAAAIGVAVGFLWAGLPFAEGAFIGVVLLVGIAANDSILLTARYRELRRARPHGPASQLARLAARERLRPMWTTTISTVVATLPLLIFPQGGAFWPGLAVTVTGGLLAATLLAPVATIALVSVRAPGQ